MTLPIFIQNLFITVFVWLILDILKFIYNKYVNSKSKHFDKTTECYQNKPISKVDHSEFQQKPIKYVIKKGFVEHLKFERTYFRNMYNDLENEQTKIYASGQIDCLNRIIDKLK